MAISNRLKLLKMARKARRKAIADKEAAKFKDGLGKVRAAASRARSKAR